MLRKALLKALLLAAFAAGSIAAAHAQMGAPAGASDSRADSSAAGAPAAPLKPAPENAHLPQYRGTLAGRPIVVRIGPRPDDPGLHGEYQFLDNGTVILLAGDREGDTLELEESNDGTNITGVWTGQFDRAGNLSATHMNPDESDQQPIELHPVK